MRAARIISLAVLLTTTPALVPVGGSGPSTPKAAARTIELVHHELNTRILLLRVNEDSVESGRRPRIRWEVANRADRPQWMFARLTPPAPNRVCEYRMRVDAKDRNGRFCTLDTAIAGVDHAFDILVFADSAFADTVESSSWVFQLRKSEVDEWNSSEANSRLLDEAEVLPRTYHGILFLQGWGGVMTWRIGKRGGALTVSAEGLDYVSEKTTLRIPAAELRGATWSWGEYEPQLIVKYRAGGKPKQATFIKASISDTTDPLYIVEVSIKALIEQSPKTGSE